MQLKEIKRSMHGAKAVADCDCRYPLLYPTATEALTNFMLMPIVCLILKTKKIALFFRQTLPGLPLSAP